MKICHECYADEKLLRTFGFSRRQVDHRGSKYRVVWAVLRLDDRIGLVDEDPGQNPSEDLGRFTTVHQEHDVEVLERGDKCIVVLSPRLEEWLLRTATLARIDVRRYGLPNDPETLHGVINDELDKLGRLLEDLRGHERMRALGGLLRNRARGPGV
jgi:hypothetical protein